MEKLTGLLSGKLIKMSAVFLLLCVIGFYANGWWKNRTVASSAQLYDAAESPAQIPAADPMQAPSSYGAIVKPRDTPPSATPPINPGGDAASGVGVGGAPNAQTVPRVTTSADSIAAVLAKTKAQTDISGSAQNTEKPAQGSVEKKIRANTATFSVPKNGTISSMFVKTYNRKVSPSSELIFQGMNTSVPCSLLGYMSNGSEIFAKGNVEKSDLGYLLYTPKAMYEKVKGGNTEFFFADDKTLVRVSVSFLDPEKRGYPALIRIR